MQDVLRHRYMMIKPAWKHPLVYYSFKFYNVTSFSLSRALKAKTYEKSHNLWTIGDIYESSLQVVNLHLTHKYNTSCHAQTGCSIEIASRRLHCVSVPVSTFLGGFITQSCCRLLVWTLTTCFELPSSTTEALKLTILDRKILPNINYC